MRAEGVEAMTRAKNETAEQAARRKARVAAEARRRRATTAGQTAVKAAHQRYDATPKGRASQKRRRDTFRATERGQDAVLGWNRRRLKRTKERVKIARKFPVPKMPRLPLFRGTARTRNAVEGERVEPFQWPGEVSGARAQAHFADWWSSIWEDVPRDQVVWGKKAGQAFRAYAKARTRRAVGVSRMRRGPVRRQRGRS